MRALPVPRRGGHAADPARARRGCQGSLTLTDFRTLATLPCPPVADLQVALATELEGPHAVAPDAALDDAPRGLFGIASLDADAQAAALQRALGELGFGCAGCGPRALLLGEAVRRRCGHPLALACVGHELARRAGVQTAVHSCGSSWLLRFRDDRGDAFVAFGEPPRDGVDARRRCSHELAYATLVGLEEGYRSCGFLARSRHAAELRVLLPVMPR